ncbi:hypothetical protein [Aurantimonas sp. VKM B-3413]|uniref:alpha/beta hydrolase family protein n=1 Tax=Aurantimonas sp. VKM B-3413 TaxID=2779401 RepID=UPI001E64DD1A|nr:hypothetical protein [Aurantimonas sp. VKM B-3413]MCB8838287.1 hypothetical protein [Aurantimonas sp. VKM B-3413]
MTIRRPLLAGIAALLLASAAHAASPAGVSPHAGSVATETALQLPGYDRFDIRAKHRSVLVAGSIWYPAAARTYAVPIGANPVFEGTEALVGAAAQTGRHPLILLSHGSGGNMDGLGWLSSELALRGALVVAVNHPGTTSGDSSPRRTPRIDERAKDLSAALDTILADPTFGPLVDQRRISALGFSLGGTAVLDLVGGHFERAKFRDYCKAFSEQGDCVFFTKGGVDFDRLPQEMEADVRDPRIASVVAVEPGLTDALSEASAKAMTLPMLLVGFGAPDPSRAVDVTASGSNLLDRLSNATYEMIRPAVHFSFLGLCKPDAAKLLREAQDDPVCTDPDGADRRKIHAEVIDSVARFLGLAEPVRAGEAHQ